MGDMDRRNALIGTYISVTHYVAPLHTYMVKSLNKGY